MTYGICNLSLIPIRKNPSDTSEMINQLLFGEHFKIIKKDSKWSHIKLAHDSYEGWICNKQWIEINEETYLRLEKEVPTITMDLIFILYLRAFNKLAVPIILVLSVEIGLTKDSITNGCAAKWNTISGSFFKMTFFI